MKRKIEGGGISLHPGPAAEAGRFEGLPGLAAFSGLPGPPAAAAAVVHPDELRVYRDALFLYNEASENLTKFGAVTAHPKTGQPMVNPYLEIRDRCGRTITSFHKANPGWKEPAPAVG
jgi:hypothetical protein